MTSHTESVLCAIGIEDDYERDVAIIDIPNAFVPAELTISGRSLFVTMETRCRFADIVVKIAPDVYDIYLERRRTAIACCVSNHQGLVWFHER